MFVLARFVVAAFLVPGAAVAALQGGGAVRTCPADGWIEPVDPVTIHAESWPAGAASGARVVYSIDESVVWSTLDLVTNGRLGEHDWWMGDLGSFPAGTVIRYAIEVLDAEGGSVWLNNGGADYYATVNGGPPLRRVGPTSHQPPNGQISSESGVTVTAFTSPQGEAVSAKLILSRDQGWSWSELAMTYAGASGSNDAWIADIGRFPAGSTNMYAVEATFADPAETKLDANNGANHQVIVNLPYAGQWIGQTRHTPPSGDIDAGDDLWIHVEARPAGNVKGARAVWSVDGGSWNSSPMSFAGLKGSNEWWYVNLGAFSAGAVIQFAVEVDFGPGGTLWDNHFGANYLAVVNSGAPSPWAGNTDHYPENGALDPEDALWVNIESKPAGQAHAASVVYSTNRGVSWASAPMADAGLRNGNDHWHVKLGAFPAGAVIEYAVQVVFPGQSVWDNNQGRNFQALVNAPAPVAWAGNTYNWPSEGSVDPGTDLWINTFTGPRDAATNVSVLYSIDDGVTWSNRPMEPDGHDGDHDRWHVNLGGFGEGTVIRYAVYAKDAYGDLCWDSNGGEDYYVRVHSILRDVYTDKSRYHPGDPAIIHVDLHHANGTNPVALEVRVTITDLFTNIAAFSTALVLPNGSGTNLPFTWQTPIHDFRGYGIDVDVVENGAVRDRRSSAIDVSSDWTRFPRYGFFSDYYPGEQALDSEAKAAALSKYHINAVQFYDWMWEHDRLIKYDCDGGMADQFEQIDGRTQSFRTVSNKVAAAWRRNITPMAYSLLYGDSGVGDRPARPEWAAYTQPWASAPHLVRQHNLAGFNPPRAIWVMDVSNPEWRGFIFNQFKDAIAKLNFGGVHLDNLGGAWNYRYQSDIGIMERTQFPDFINRAREAIRTTRSDARVIHNDVAGNYLSDIAGSQEDVYYQEVWGQEHYRDIRALIGNARTYSGGTKQVVLAAYMNLFNYSNVLSEASVRLMDAVTFAHGAFRIELGEGVEYLTNHYFPMHWPPARESLMRALRAYYSFIVRYENLLSFNTLGGVADATDPALTYSATDALSKNGEPGTVWTVVRRWKDEVTAVNLINLHGVDGEWRNRSPRPTPRLNVHLKYYVDKNVRQAFIATPDDGLGRPQAIPFIEGADDLGPYIEVVVPRVDYWTLLVLDQRTGIKVDGWPGDWQAAPPSGIHQVRVANGEWIYRGDQDDFRTFAGATSDSDITEVRLTCDETYVYFMVRMQDITDVSRPAIGIAWNSHRGAPGAGHAWIGDGSTPTGSIALEDSEQFATRQIMVYTPTGGEPTIRLWDGGIWYAPPSGGAAVAIRSVDDCVEFRVHRDDLDLNYPSAINLTLASFRSSGQPAGADATFDSPDGNNDAVDVMGGDPGHSANAWGRDLFDNRIGRYYPVVMDESGATETLAIAWPFAEGGVVDMGLQGDYTIVARFSESLPMDRTRFTLAINGVEQDRNELYFDDQTPGDYFRELRYDWTDTRSGSRLIEVWYDDDGRSLYASRTCTINPDTDGDGILDAIEDRNRDGQRQLQETDATAMDTDGDGLIDGVEDGDRNGSIAGDANGNLRHERGEQWTETDPRTADTDGDGLPDGWEIAHGLNPWDNGITGAVQMNTGLAITNPAHGAAGDPDNDGVSNEDERRAGTDPQDADSHLCFIDMVSGADRPGWLIWASISGKQYRVFSSPDPLLPFQPLNHGQVIRAENTKTAFSLPSEATPSPVQQFQLRLVD